MTPVETWVQLAALVFALSVLAYGWLELQDRKRAKAIRQEFEELDANRRLDAAMRVSDRRRP